MLIHLSELTEQTGKQRHEDEADESDAAAGHELLHALAFGSGVVVAVAFQKVDGTPDGETGAEGDDEGLKNVYCAVEEIHSDVAGERTRRLPQTTWMRSPALLSKIISRFLKVAVLSFAS